MAAGQLPMFFGGQFWSATFAAQPPNHRYSLAPIPVVERPATVYDAVGVCTPKYTAESDATRKVLQFISSR